MSELVKLSNEAMQLLKALFVVDENGAVAVKLKMVTAADFPDRALTSTNGLDVAAMLNKALVLEDGIVSIRVARDENVENGLLLGDTSDTAYRGDRGVIAYNFSQATNKKKTSTAATAAALAINADAVDMAIITALAEPMVIDNPTGTPLDGQELVVRIKDNATARALTYGSTFRAMGVALPNTTVISKTMYLHFMYNVADTKWDLYKVSQQA